jgi:hypothetical protein
MKTLLKLKTVFAVLGMMLATTFPVSVSGQTTMSILPINTSSVNTQFLNAQQWQGVSLQMQDQFVSQLTSIGTISKLTREHILLLLKEMPAPDPESLNSEAYKIISKKENLHYLLKCSIESIQMIDKSVLAHIHIIIVDGNNGKVFWEKIVKTNKVVSNTSLNEHILLNEVFKPFINEISKEIKALKY